ncbi:MAG: TorD/DmsD family molecular chaperone [Halapricum sp.]
MTTTDSTDTTALMELYDFASGAFADPLDASAIEALLSGPLPEPDAVRDEQLAAGLAGLAEWIEGVDDPQAAADELEAVHTDLFVGPRPSLQIHESYYAGDFLGDPLASVQSTFQQLGIRPAGDLREEADHVAVELAALRELSAAGDQEAKATFLREHGWWFEDLAADIHETADHDLYRAVGDIAAGLVTLDADRLGVEL